MILPVLWRHPELTAFGRSLLGPLREPEAWAVANTLRIEAAQRRFDRADATQQADPRDIQAA